MLRLSPPGYERMSRGEVFDKRAGGSELNVAAGVAHLGLRTGIISKLPDNSIGAFIKNRIRFDGVSDDNLIYDRSDDARLGIYYYEYGAAPRKPSIIYDRQNSSFTKLSLDDISDSVYSRCRESMAGFRKIVTDRADSAISRICSSMGYGEYMHKMGFGVNKINILRALGKQEENVSNFLKRMDKLCDIIRSKKSDPKSNFTMTTIHTSKGLEYDEVYLIDVYDSLFPEKVVDRKRCTDSDVLRLYEEERRLFYVGMTRAKNKLFLLSYDDKKSTFINELFQSNEKVQRRSTATRFNKSNNRINAIDYKKFQEKMSPKAIITHKTFGKGVISNRAGDIITVQFEQGVTKKLSVKSLYSFNLIKVE